MTIAYNHSPRLIHGLVSAIAPDEAIDPSRDTWSLHVHSGTPLTTEQLDAVTAAIVERLNENKRLSTATSTLEHEWKKDIADRNRLQHALKIVKDVLQPLAPQEASPEMLAANAASELRRLRAVNSERVNDLAAIEQHAKVVGQLQDRHAAALGYCKRHNHSGVDKAAHCYLNRVIEILEGQQPADLPAAR